MGLTSLPTPVPAAPAAKPDELLAMSAGNKLAVLRRYSRAVSAHTALSKGSQQNVIDAANLELRDASNMLLPVILGRVPTDHELASAIRYADDPPPVIPVPQPPLGAND
jgi:hypothetical protein